MAQKTRTVLDADHAIYTESLDINEVFLGPEGAIPFRVTKRRLHGGTRDGVDIIEVDNGRFTFTILKTRGMGIWKGRCGDVELKWDSPVHGPTHPRYVPIYAPNGIGWLEGFDEWLVRCGLESNGAAEFDENGVLRWPLHGRIANTPARRVKVSVNPETGEITVQGVIEEAGLFTKRLALYVTYTTFAGSSELTIRDIVVNRSSSPGEFELLYHINTGMPFLTPGAKIMAPFHEMCPRDANAANQLDEWDIYHPEEAGTPERCYLFDMATDRENCTKALLINARNDRGLTVSFNKKDFPHFLIWKLQRPNGDTYVTGMEPCVNFPNTRSFEKKHGRVVTLGPNESRTFEIKLEVLHNHGAISETVHYIQRLQSGAKGTVLPEPKPEWCE